MNIRYYVNAALPALFITQQDVRNYFQVVDELLHFSEANHALTATGRQAQTVFENL
jgi:hypothetical protein